MDQLRRCAVAIMGSGEVIAIDEPGVRGFLHVCENALGEGLVLTHGAGANAQSPLLNALANALANSGVAVLRFDLPFRQLRPHGPPPRGSAERDQEGLRVAVEWLRHRVAGRVYLGGHSYGGRQASMLAAREPELVTGLLLLSYPLHPPKQPEQLRTAHFPSLRMPSLFVHGSRDEFATDSELTEALQSIPATKEIMEIPGAGHSLVSRGKEEHTAMEVAGNFLHFFGLGHAPKS